MSGAILMKAVLVVLIGVYAVRASWFLFSGTFSPLTPVAAAVLVLCIVTFHHPPQSVGPWLYTLITACAIGAIANGALLFTASPLYANAVNTAFSWVSLACFILLAASLAGSVWGRG